MKTIKLKVDDTAYADLLAKATVEGVTVPALVRWATCLYLTATVQDVPPNALWQELER